LGEGGVEIVTAVKGLFRVRPLASERLDRGAMTIVLETLKVTWKLCVLALYGASELAELMADLVFSAADSHTTRLEY